MTKAHIIYTVVILVVVGFALSSYSALVNSGVFARGESAGHGAESRQLPAPLAGSHHQNPSQPTVSQATCVAPPSGMLNWYPGDGDAGDIRGGRAGTLRNGATFGPGKVLQAFALDGQNDFVDVGDLDLPGTFTIDAWINPTQFSGFPHILDKDSVIDERSYYFSLDNRRLELFVKSGTPTNFRATRYRTTQAAVTVGEWQFVAVTYDGGAPAGERVKFYRNGVNLPATVQFGQDDGGPPENNAFPARIGMDSAENGFAFGGLIDELEIFDRVLLPAELLQIFNADSAGKCKPSAECTFSISPISQTFGQQGGTGSVAVTQTSTGPQTCRWRVTPGASIFPFVTILTGMSGSGSGGTFTYRVDANPDPINGRSATIDLINEANPIGGQTFTVLQPGSGGPCTYRLTPASRTVISDMNSQTVRVETQMGCSWRASAGPSWINFPFSDPSGTGPGSFSYTVSSNDGPDFRTGVIAVAGQGHVVTQLGSKACPVEQALADDRTSLDDKNRFRGFRDEVLERTSHGKKYSEEYYLYAGEITKLMIFSPTLFFRTKEVLERYAPVMESVLKRERAKGSGPPEGGTQYISALGPTIVYDSEIDDVDAILASFAAESSVQLRQTLEGLRKDIRDPKVQAEFGVQVERGEKRPLPGRERSMIEKLSGLWDLGSKLDLSSPFSRTRPVAETARQTEAPRADVETATMADDKYGRIPLSFEANQGQVDPSVKYLARGAGFNLFLTKNEAVLALRDKSAAKAGFEDYPGGISRLSNQRPETPDERSHTLRMKLDGANERPRITGRDELAGKSNYFIGRSASEWRTGIRNYSLVEYEDVYRGIDLVYYGNQRQLEYDFKVAPGADPENIRMRFEGANKVEVDAGGDLLLQTAEGEVRLRAPITYQEIDGVRQEISSRYFLTQSPKAKDQSPKAAIVGFELGDYDKDRPLVIDPVLVYSTYLGGSGEDLANSITIDSAGNAYLIGFTDSTNFPVAGAIRPTYGGNPQDVFVSKLNPAGTALVYSTYLGGSGQDNGSDIAVDAAGNAYITGYAGSTNFPIANALQPTRTGLYNAFVAKLNPNGSQLIYST